MNLLIKNIAEVQCDPDYPMIDVTIDGRPDMIAQYIAMGMTFQGYLRGKVNHASNMVNKLTSVVHNEFHLKLDGPDVLKLQIGDYLVPSSN